MTPLKERLATSGVPSIWIPETPIPRRLTPVLTPVVAPEARLSVREQRRWWGLLTSGELLHAQPTLLVCSTDLGVLLRGVYHGIAASLLRGGHTVAVSTTPSRARLTPATVHIMQGLSASTAPGQLPAIKDWLQATGGTHIVAYHGSPVDALQQLRTVDWSGCFALARGT